MVELKTQLQVDLRLLPHWVATPLKARRKPDTHMLHTSQPLESLAFFFRIRF